MTDWEGETANGVYRLRIKAPALLEAGRLCTAAGVVETGGVLVGRYSSDLVVATVREATPPPPDSRQGRTRFNRGVAGLSEMLARRWESKERTYYLGEWHYHPAEHVEPSAVDIEQMYDVRDDPNYHCANPILLILGKRGKGTNPNARAFVFPRRAPDMEIIRLPNRAPMNGNNEYQVLG